MYGSVRGVPGNWNPYRDRRQLFETTSSLSVSGKESVPPGELFLAVAIGFLRRSDSRGSIHRRSQARASNTRVSDSTLCPLGQSKKAIGHESPIGPCVATHKVDNCHACCFRNACRRRNKGMEPQGRGNVPALQAPERNKRFGLRKTTPESRGHVQAVGLNAEQSIGIAPKGRHFS